jgi:F0F1-type ATP synthase membrane subunit c/vacuolar-type H+-ATPase subunit K
MVRIIHGCLLASIVAYAFIMLYVPAQAATSPDRVLLPIFASLSVALLIIGFVVRAKTIGHALETLRQRPDDAHSLAQWRKGVVVTDALAEAVVLYGVVLHFLGWPIGYSAAFMAAGAFVMLIWFPQRP